MRVAFGGTLELNVAELRLCGSPACRGGAMYHLVYGGVEVTKGIQPGSAGLEKFIPTTHHRVTI